MSSSLLQVYKKCAPSSILKDGTCFRRNELVCLLNSALRLLDVKGPTQNDIDQMSNEEMITIFDYFMKANIETTNSWIENPELMKHISQTCPLLAESILFYRIVPSYHSSNGKGWTNNFQLSRIVRQFVAALRGTKREFAFDGAYHNKPMKVMCRQKAQCLSPMTNHFKLRPNVPWSIILNVTRKGSHWIALFRASNVAPLEYFDSFGKSIPESLQSAINWLCKDERKPLKIIVNRRRHQYDEYSCGPFSAYFIIQRASGFEFEWFQENTISSSEMADFRDSVFDIDPAKTLID